MTTDKLRKIKEKYECAKIQAKKCADAMEESDKKLVEAMTAMDGLRFDIEQMELDLKE